MWRPSAGWHITLVAPQVGCKAAALEYKSFNNREWPLRYAQSFGSGLQNKYAQLKTSPFIRYNEQFKKESIIAQES